MNSSNKSCENHTSKKILKQKTYILSEKDFYPPLDDRVYESNLDNIQDEDIQDGYSFVDYIKEFNDYIDKFYNEY